GYHERHRRFAPLRRRHANHRRIGNARVLAQDRFEVAGINIEAARNHHVLAPVHQREEAVLVEAADIAGADVAVALAVVPLGFARLGGLVVVAGHHRAGAAHDFADLAGAKFAFILVDQPYVVTFGRLADGVQFLREVVRLQDAGTAAFGQAVELAQPAGPALDDV